MRRNITIRGESVHLHSGAGASWYAYQGGHHFLFMRDPDAPRRWQLRWQVDQRPTGPYTAPTSPTFTIGASAKTMQDAAKRFEFDANIETARGDALACLDAWEERHVFLTPDQSSSFHEQKVLMNKVNTAVVLAYAIDAYRFSNPKSTSWRLWIFRFHGDRIGSKRDVHCLFCDERLESDAKFGHDYWTNNPKITDHVVPCALRYLIGMEPEKQVETP